MPRLTNVSKLLITLAILAVVYLLIKNFAPQVKIGESQKLEKIQVSDTELNNRTTSDELNLPKDGLSASVASLAPVKLAGYAWNAQSGIIVANGGPKTTEGSIMEKNGLNVEIIRQDWLTELRNLQMKFIEEFDKGNPNPKEGAAGIMIMGDGAPYYISSAQQALDDKYGAGKYQLEIVGAIGMSQGEDKLIGPPSWKMDPQRIKGSLISAVIGDGDWVTAVNFAFANGVKVNPDPSTYDAEAMNFLPSANDDYIESAKELIKSQKQNWTVPLKEVINGKVTGKTIDKKVDGCATWTPGDKMVFDELTGFTDVISTKEFNNQMPTVIIVLKQWAEKNSDVVTKILKSTFTATNQMKQYDSWQKKAAADVAKTFNMETQDYWYTMFKGTSGEKGGISYNMGGSKVLNYADAKQYFGQTDGINRYKSVYDQVSNYLKVLNPAGFNQNVKSIVTYENAVKLKYLNAMSDVDAGVAEVSDYSKKATNLIASGEWNISFDNGRASLRPDANDVLNQIYNLLVQAETSKLEIIGHTDNTGNKESNYALSSSRAEAVKTYLLKKGLPISRFQKIDGKGQDAPVGDNTTDQGKAKNRRVEIRLLK
jgi:OmpA-OmpF porin, OOP family